MPAYRMRSSSVEGAQHVESGRKPSSPEGTARRFRERLGVPIGDPNSFRHAHRKTGLVPPENIVNNCIRSCFEVQMARSWA
jgi:hypothetical protein